MDVDSIVSPITEVSSIFTSEDRKCQCICGNLMGSNTCTLEIIMPIHSNSIVRHNIIEHFNFFFGIDIDIKKDDKYIINITCPCCLQCIIQHVISTLNIDLVLSDISQCIWITDKSIVIDKFNGLDIITKYEIPDLKVPSNIIELRCDGGDVFYIRNTEKLSTTERINAEKDWSLFLSLIHI